MKRSISTKRKVRLFIDKYPRTTCFVIAGVVALLSIMTAGTLEVIYGVGKAEPFTGFFGGLGVITVIGMIFAAPLTLTHWSFNG